MDMHICIYFCSSAISLILPKDNLSDWLNVCKDLEPLWCNVVSSFIFVVDSDDVTSCMTKAISAVMT